MDGIIDDVGTRKTRMKAAKAIKKTGLEKICYICKKTDHKTTKCNYFSQFQNYVKNNPVAENGKRKCSLCQRKMNHLAPQCIYLEHFRNLYKII